MMVALLSFPGAGLADSILLSASSFTLLGGTTISSSGATNITHGNVGLSPGATTGITGFPPANITGGSIIDTGAITDQAMADLMTATAGLAGMPFSMNLTDTPDLGGRTLLPGVYRFDSAAALNGVLTLDANGQNDAYWVFQIGTALTTGASAAVISGNYGSNGGNDDGIFWNVGSAITFGANNLMLGNYLAGTSITFGTNTSGEGRGLALAAITLSSSLDNTGIDSQGGPFGSDWTGGLTYGPGGSVVPIPEPVAFQWLVSLLALVPAIKVIMTNKKTIRT